MRTIQQLASSASMHHSLQAVFGSLPAGVHCRERAAAYGVIRNMDGAVGVVSDNVRGRDEFWLPGGGMLAGETPSETVVREVQEELGCEVRLKRELGRAVQYFFAGDQNCWYRMTAWFFAAEFGENRTHRGEYELQWVDPNLRRLDFFHECHVWAALECRAPGSRT